ncbi:MAG: sensor histidine kinase [Crocinitomicaceae bacterium]
MKYINRKERMKIVGFNDYLLMAVVIPVFSFFFPVFVFDLKPSDGLALFFTSTAVAFVHIIIFWIVERYMVIYIRKAYPKFSDYKKRLIIQSVAVVLSTLVLCQLSEIVELCFGTRPEVFDVSFAKIYFGSLVVTTIIITIYEGIYSFQLYKQSLIKNQELEKKNTQAQLDVLKNQVNPHFLFNSLNTLISIIPEDSETAVNFTEKLSSVYRYILEIRDKEIITLAEELECIEAYRFLLSIRFNEHIKFKFENLTDLNGKHIVPLSVQMLLENAIKHNIISKAKPLTITIKIENNKLLVCNNLQLKTTYIDSTGVGIKNIEQRYKLLANKKITVQQTSDQFCVELPILNIKEVK